VGVKIPNEARCHLDAPFLPAKIIELKENNFYILSFRELNFGDNHNEVPEITLREAARKVSLANLVGTSCNCTKNCSNNRCVCKKSNTPCNFKCHKGKTCLNCEKEKNRGQDSIMIQ